MRAAPVRWETRIVKTAPTDQHSQAAMALRRRATIMQPAMDCRPNCAACCTAPSISSAIPGMPHGKPAGVPCIQLDEQLRCQLFASSDRPAVCSSLRPSAEMCGENKSQAMLWLRRLDAATTPYAPAP